MNPVGYYNYMLEEMRRRYSMDMPKNVLYQMLPNDVHHYMLPGVEHIPDTNISKTVGIIIANPKKAFVKEEILDNIEYANTRSGLDIDFFFAGYYGDRMYGPQCIEINAPNGKKWYFCVDMFNEFIETLERKSEWKYSGETELLLLEFKNHDLCFDKVISIWIDRAVQEGSIYSASYLFENIYRIAREGNMSVNRLSNGLGSENIKDSAFDLIGSFLNEHIVGTIKSTAIFAVKNYSKKD